MSHYRRARANVGMVLRLTLAMLTIFLAVGGLDKVLGPFTMAAMVALAVWVVINFQPGCRQCSRDRAQ